MIYHSIFHKPTGRYLPRLSGSTHYDPEMWKGAPRLFSKKSQAKGFLTNYCKGAFRSLTEYGGLDGFMEEIVIVKQSYDVQFARNREEFEIHSFRLVREV